MYLQLTTRKVSDVIVLREAIPETADVVAPLDARHQPRFTTRWRLPMPSINLQKSVTRPPAPRRVFPFFAGRYSHAPGAPGPRGVIPFWAKSYSHRCDGLLDPARLHPNALRQAG
jgi:hypothetical protein